jgi:putative ABC transport system permease protein
MIDSIFHDVRFAIRQLRRAPFFSFSVMLTLALSIGATAALTSVLRATLLHPLPYPQAGQLLTIQDENLRGFKSNGLVSVLRTSDLAKATANGKPLFSSLGYFYSDDSTLTVSGHDSIRVPAVAVSGGFFSTLGSAPLLGRTMIASDDVPKGPQVLVLSERLWRTTFAADPNVIGRTVRLGADSATIIGVMPAAFNYPYGVDLWHPGHVFPSSFGSYRGDGSRFVEVIARLAPGQTFASARAATSSLAAQLARAYPDTDSAWGFSLTTLRDSLFGEYRQALLLLGGAVLLVLLVAAVNIAGLQLSRNAARAPEFAIRSALGITRARLTRQLLTESLLLVLAGSAAGVGLAIALLRTIAAHLPSGLLLVEQPRVDPFTLGVALLAGLAVALFTATIPALQARRHAAPTATRTLVSNTRIFGKTFAALQIALSLVLLVLSTSVLQSLYRLLTTPLGFAPDHLITFTVDLPWGANMEKTRLLYTQLEESFAAMPGVTGAGSITALPLTAFNGRATYDIAGQPPTPHQDAVVVESRGISTGYLQTMHIPLLAGRPFTLADQLPTAPRVDLVNETMVRRYFPGQNPIGRRLTFTPAGGKPVTIEIIGVVADVQGTSGSLSSPVAPEVYEPMHGYWPHQQFVLRSSLPLATLQPQIRKIVLSSDSIASPGHFDTLDKILDGTLVQPRLNASLLTAFAALSLLLVVIGVYGLVAFDVAQRTRELGLRIALGSSRGGVLALLLVDSTRMLGAGLALGLISSFAASRLLAAAIFGPQPHLAALLLTSAVILTLAVLTATLLPAARAARIDPMEALRTE